MGKRGFTHESTKNESKEWYTPAGIFVALGLDFDLDPCAAPPGYRDFVPAKSRHTIFDNGLIKSWKGLVFVNPPYGRDTPAWAQRFVGHGNGIMLVFARTDARWFHELVPQADLLCFTNGRISFIRPDGTRGDGPGAGSLFVAMGNKSVAALERSELGLLWMAKKRTAQGVML